MITYLFTPKQKYDLNKPIIFDDGFYQSIYKPKTKEEAKRLEDVLDQIGKRENWTTLSWNTPKSAEWIANGRKMAFKPFYMKKN